MNRASAYIDLVLVGGGHAQVQVLKAFAMTPEDGVRLTVITDVLDTPYSGMLPGHIEGLWSAADMHINLVKLARYAGARLIHKSVKDIDLINKTIILEDDLPIRYDVLSLNCGAAPDLHAIPGADRFAVAVKPISRFLEKLPAPADISGPILLIGAGAAGAELALAFRQRYGPSVEIHLVGRSAHILPTRSARAGRLLETALRKHNIRLHLGRPVSRITETAVHFDANKQIEAHHIFLVTAVRPADWTSGLGLQKDADGFLAVSPALQSVSHDSVFAAGDIASVQGFAREKAGVFAVRAGPVLAHNLRAYIRGRVLHRWRPQRQYLALIGLGRRQAVASWGPFATSGSVWWTLKAAIDRRFMARFSDLPVMTAQSQTPPVLARQLGRSPQTDEAMFCAACGAKTTARTLRDSINQACDIAVSLGADPAYLPDRDITADQAEFALPDTTGRISQSVDYISQHISDPFCFGRIAALHALSDIFVAGHQPFAALATVILQREHNDLQADDLALMLAGSLVELARHKTKLVGGHTSVAAEAGLGFTLTGQAEAGSAQHARGGVPQHTDNPETTVLILTKPVGTGIILAAEMRQCCPADSFAAALDVMLQSNFAAAQIFAGIDGALMTDVTGFGLAGHAVNLSRRAGAAGALLRPAACPVIDGALLLSEQGVLSSAFAGNLENLPDVIGQTDSPAARLMFDPQTSGGILAALPEQNAEETLIRLKQAGYKTASVIGHLSATTGLTLSDENRSRI